MSYEQMQNNRVLVTGKVISEPEFSHEMMGEGFYDLAIAVKRLSGQDDIVPLTISERLMDGVDFSVGATLGVVGQFRSYNKFVGERSKLVLRVFVRELTEPNEDNPNIIELEGFICKQPVYRQTPFKREIADMLIAVNRAYNKSDYIPAIAWGRNARYAGSLEVGSKIHVAGRIQSRVYQKQLEDGEIEERTAYEVSISKLEFLGERPAPRPFYRDSHEYHDYRDSRESRDSYEYRESRYSHDYRDYNENEQPRDKSETNAETEESVPPIAPDYKE